MSGLGRLKPAVQRLEEISAADPANAGTRSELAMASSRLGEVWSIKASARGLDRSQALNGWSQAREWYTKSLSVWKDMEAKGTLGGGNFAGEEAQALQKAASHIARCDAALAKLEPHGRGR